MNSTPIFAYLKLETHMNTIPSTALKAYQKGASKASNWLRILVCSSPFIAAKDSQQPL